MVRPIKGNLDFEHLKAIHKYLFQDLYDWAGKTRTCNIAKKQSSCFEVSPVFLYLYEKNKII